MTDTLANSADYLVWGIVLHLLIDWLAQNEYIAVNKISLKHPAAYVHASMHGAVQLLIFPWWAALFIGITHLLIDLRTPVAWWSKLIRQTQPNPTTNVVQEISRIEAMEKDATVFNFNVRTFDIGSDVRIWVDQVSHIGVIALASLAVTV